MVVLVGVDAHDSQRIKEIFGPIVVVNVGRLEEALHHRGNEGEPLIIILDSSLVREARSTIIEAQVHSLRGPLLVVPIGEEGEHFDEYPHALIRPLAYENLVPLLGVYLSLYQTYLHEAPNHQRFTLKTLFQQLPFGITVFQVKQTPTGAKGTISLVNPMFEEILGRSRKEIIDLGVEGCTHPNDWPHEKALLHQLVEGTVTNYSMNKRIVRGDGSVVWTHIMVVPFTLKQYNEGQFLCVLQETTEEYANVETVRAKKEIYDDLLGNLRVVAYQAHLDENLTVFFITDACYELSGYTSTELTSGEDFFYGNIMDPATHDDVINRLHKQIQEERQIRIEYEIITKSGERKWVLEIGRVKDGDVPILEGIIIDFNRYKELELSRFFENDRIPLSGLKSRNALRWQITEDGEKELKQKSALFSINFTSLYGLVLRFDHSYVESLTKEIAKVLERFKSDKNLVYGPFEYRFAIYVREYPDRAALEALGHQIIEEVGVLLQAKQVSWGIGIIEIDWSEALDAEQILHRVVVASDSAFKEKSPHPAIYFYDRAMSDLVQRETILLQELTEVANGIQPERLSLHYQPIVSVKTNAIHSFEALARFTSNTLGSVKPAEFIPIAEKYRLIIPLGYEIFRQALRFQKRLERAALGSLCITINVSAFQLLELDFPHVLSTLLLEEGVDPSNVVLELTEVGISSTLVRVNAILKTLQSLGMRIALDDFGVGYSSLARESELNVDFVKIDKLFADQVLKYGPERSVLGDVISMVHKMGHTTVVEGIEEADQLQYIKDQNAVLYQGYFYAKPMEEEEAFTACIEKQVPATDT